eukprot:scaffold71223_cov36-Tisochrysis_lutea.AAC.1
MTPAALDLVFSAELHRECAQQELSGDRKRALPMCAPRLGDRRSRDEARDLRVGGGLAYPQRQSQPVKDREVPGLGGHQLVARVEAINVRLGGRAALLNVVERRRRDSRAVAHVRAPDG